MNAQGAQLTTVSLFTKSPRDAFHPGDDFIKIHKKLMMKHSYWNSDWQCLVSKRLGRPWGCLRHFPSWMATSRRSEISHSTFLSFPLDISTRLCALLTTPLDIPIRPKMCAALDVVRNVHDLFTFTIISYFISIGYCACTTAISRKENAPKQTF